MRPRVIVPDFVVIRDSGNVEAGAAVCEFLYMDSCAVHGGMSHVAVSSRSPFCGYVG